jgi:hypothetical protein
MLTKGGEVTEVTPAPFFHNVDCGSGSNRVQAFMRFLMGPGTSFYWEVARNDDSSS